MKGDAFLEIIGTTPLFKQMERSVVSGDYSGLDSEAKQQHFIPRFHLKRFSQVDDAGKYFLYQLAVRGGQPKRVQIEEAASGRYFYAAVDEAGTRHNRIEGFLAVVENHAAPAFAQLLDSPEKLSDGDRATLAFFLALLDGRTPGATKRGSTTLDTMMRMMLASGFSDLTKFQRTYRELFGEATDEEIEEFRRRTLEMLKTNEAGYEDPRMAAVAAAFEVSTEVAELIFDMKWTFLKSADQHFVTSDRGLAMFDPSPVYPWGGNAWRSSPRAQTTIPLSSLACLLIEPGERSLEVVDVEPSRVEQINLRTYGWAADYVYGESQDIVVELRRLAKRRPAEIVRPNPNHQMVVFEPDPEDTTYADAHRRRGWPPYVPADGQPHDYLVIGIEGGPVEIIELTSRIVKQRARRRLGLRDDEPLPGEPAFEPASLG